MANRGNTGQRYKMPHVTETHVLVDGNLEVILACGHSLIYRYYLTPFTPERAERMMNKRVRCDKCSTAAEAKR